MLVSEMSRHLHPNIHWHNWTPDKSIHLPKKEGTILSMKLEIQGCVLSETPITRISLKELCAEALEEQIRSRLKR